MIQNDSKSRFCNSNASERERETSAKLVARFNLGYLQFSRLCLAPRSGYRSTRGLRFDGAPSRLCFQSFDTNMAPLNPRGPEETIRTHEAWESMGIDGNRLFHDFESPRPLITRLTRWPFPFNFTRRSMAHLHILP